MKEPHLLHFLESLKKKYLFSLANLRVSIIFLELPDVVIAKSTSPGDKAEKTLLKISSGP